MPSPTASPIAVAAIQRGGGGAMAAEAPQLYGAEDGAGDQSAEERGNGPSTAPTISPAAKPPSGNPRNVTIHRAVVDERRVARARGGRELVHGGS